MDIFDIKEALKNIVVLVDTREQKTPALQRRLESIGYPYLRQKLDFGDYSAKTYIGEKEFDFSSVFCIERKMSLDELCACYGNGRKRFEKEFERAKISGAKTYLLIEKADFEKAYYGEYRSMMNPKSLVASMLAWLARYDCQILFCQPETSGKLIRDVIYREIKERFERGDYD